MAYKTLNLDLAKAPTGMKPMVYGRIGDSDMQTVTVNITSRDVPVDLTGFTITFEGITNGEKTKVFDVSGIDSTAEGLKKGTFDYTFPNMAFAVGGSYEIAYFSIVKGDERDTTGEFDITVASNADIDAAEAETIITEYNKLVQELHALTEDYISETDDKFSTINATISDLQAQITAYNESVETTANAALTAIEAALAEFEEGTYYTKSEVDEKIAAIDAANDSEVVHLTGDETIGGKKTFTGELLYSENKPRKILSYHSGWSGERAWYIVKNGVLIINIPKSGPTLTISGVSHTAATLPESIYSLIPDDVPFVWSGEDGQYSGKVDATNGEIKFYLPTEESTLGNTKRYSMYQVIILGFELTKSKTRKTKEK
ncbi:BppU family phage baseplate upper protein [Lactococcus garvieae]|uniref:BppU family phage baseplate upper protein n=1 Tax=Lactococcus garvieae TaxID=1363 RepID=UPI00324F0A32